MKKRLALLLTMVMMISLVPAIVLVSGAEYDDGAYYSILSEFALFDLQTTTTPPAVTPSGVVTGGGGAPAVFPRQPTDRPPRTSEAITNIDGVEVEIQREGTRAIIQLTALDTRELIDNVVGDTVVFNIAELPGFYNVREARLPRAALIGFANAGLSMEVELSIGTLTLTPEALLAVAGQGSNLITLSIVNVPRPLLTARQRNALQHGDLIIRPRVMAGIREIEDFGANISLTITADSPTGVWHLGSNGALTPVTAATTATSATFTVSESAVFVIR